jgi:hypothetical protein
MGLVMPRLSFLSLASGSPCETAHKNLYPVERRAEGVPTALSRINQEAARTPALLELCLR